MKSNKVSLTVASHDLSRSDPSAMRWDGPAVEARLRRAADTLRRLPVLGPERYLRQRGSWPAVLREFSDLVYQAELRRDLSTVRQRRVAVSPAEIAEMDEALAWLSWIADRRVHWIVIARAIGGAQWKVIGAEVERRDHAGGFAGRGLGRYQCRKLYCDGLAQIAARLNAGPA